MIKSLKFNNGNWTEWIAIWSEIISVSSIGNLLVWFKANIARHEVQISTYHSHFEIAEFSQYRYFIDQLSRRFVEKSRLSGFPYNL